MKIFPFVVLLLTNLTHASSSWSDWSGQYDNIDCGTKEECAKTAGALNMQGRKKEAMPYMAQACLKGHSNFCNLVAMNSRKPRHPDDGVKFLRQGCLIDAKMDPNCHQLIYRLLGQSYSGEAKKLFKDLCTDTSNHWCDFMQKPGPKTPKSIAQEMSRARTMVEEACSEGHAVACNIKIIHP